MSPEARERSFDALATEMASGNLTRGRAIKLMGAALVGGALASIGIGEAAADNLCKPNGKKCRKDAQCCSGLECVETSSGRRCAPACVSCGGACASDGECCDGLQCINGSCLKEFIGCDCFCEDGFESSCSGDGCCSAICSDHLGTNHSTCATSFRC
jgi:hypothetical protein